MKKQETPAQPKVVPDAVAAGFPPPLRTGALRFPYAPKNSVCTRTHGNAAQLTRFHAELNLARPRTAARRNV
ncbi:MAG: hypothetical protein IJO06_13675 [Thermoguttaceae bacterium]|nr:hypothetical protein [Thermoguttaceae bacterium]